jgi:hypothetical protein
MGENARSATTLAVVRQANSSVRIQAARAVVSGSAARTGRVREPLVERAHGPAAASVTRWRRIRCSRSDQVWTGIESQALGQDRARLTQGREHLGVATGPTPRVRPEDDHASATSFFGPGAATIRRSTRRVKASPSLRYPADTGSGPSWNRRVDNRWCPTATGRQRGHRKPFGTTPQRP